MAGQYKVAFLGPPTSYTHQAALKFFRNTQQLQPCTWIKDIFTAVQDGQADFGVVPFENTTNGSVAFTLDLLTDRDARHKDVRVGGKVCVAVRHCLLGRRAPAGPGLSSSSGGKKQDIDPGGLAHIHQLYSHPQAWGQCEAFLSKHFARIEPQDRHDTSSTSQAAERAAADPSGASAAVSSVQAAEASGLDVLVEGIQDRDDNVTKFFVLYHDARREELLPVARHPGGDAGGRDDDDGDDDDDDDDDPDGVKCYRTLITFTVPHDGSGALADVLQVFKSHGVNLTTLHQCPRLPVQPQVMFCAVLQGRSRRHGKGGLVNDALESLGQRVQWKWLGDWLHPDDEVE